MSDTIPVADSDLWQHIVDNQHALIDARMKLFSDRSSLIFLIRKGLHQPAERSVALDIAAILPNLEKRQLLPDLLNLAAFVHGSTRQVRSIILSLGRAWLKENIDKLVEPILDRNDYEEYASLLELYLQIDSELALHLASRAAQHENPDIRDVGNEFLADLEQ